MSQQRRRAMSLGECQMALAIAQQQAAEFNDKYLRAAAVIDTMRKNAERDTTQRINQRIRSFALRLIEVADNLERALAHATEDNPVRVGVQATLEQLQAELRQEGIIPISAEVGMPFNPYEHEAIGGHEAEVAQDTVDEIIQTGYTFEGQLLRPTRVIVAHPTRTG